MKACASVKQQPKAAASLADKVLVFGAAASLLQVAPASADVDVAAVPAKAEPAVDAAVGNVVDAVKAAGGFVKSGLELFGAGAQVVKQGIDYAAPVVKQGYDTVAPAVSEAVRVTSDVATPLFNRAAPVVKDSLTGALQSTGLDLNAVSSKTTELSAAAQGGATAATPLLTKVVNFVTTTEPVLLGEYALGLVAAYYLAPPVLGLVFGSFRGFAGEVTAASALDLVNKDGNTVIVDIRTEKEKDGSGLPDVPGAASSRYIEVEFALTEDRKLRGQLRDSRSVAAQVTALQISALKKLSRGSRVLLLDRYGSDARTVAKELARKGFGRVFVVSGGFDGGNGWVKSKLQVKPTANFGSAAPSGVFGTISSRGNGAGRKALPAPRG